MGIIPSKPNSAHCEINEMEESEQYKMTKQYIIDNFTAFGSFESPQHFEAAKNLMHLFEKLNILTQRERFDLRMFCDDVFFDGKHALE